MLQPFVEEQQYDQYDDHDSNALSNSVCRQRVRLDGYRRGPLPVDGSELHFDRQFVGRVRSAPSASAAISLV